MNPNFQREMSDIDYQKFIVKDQSLNQGNYLYHYEVLNRQNPGLTQYKTDLPNNYSQQSIPILVNRNDPPLYPIYPTLPENQQYPTIDYKQKKYLEEEENKKHLLCYGLIDDRDPCIHTCCKLICFIPIFPIFLVIKCIQKLIWPCIIAICEGIEYILKKIFQCVIWFLTPLIDCVKWMCKQIKICIVSLCKFIFNCIKAILNVFFQLLSLIFNCLYKYILSPFINCLIQICKFVKQILETIGKCIYEIFKALYKCIRQHILRNKINLNRWICKTIFSCLSAIIEVVYNYFLKYIIECFKTILNAILSIIKCIWTTLLQPLFNAIFAIIKAIFNVIKQIVSQIFKIFYTVFTGMWNCIKVAFGFRDDGSKR